MPRAIYACDIGSIRAGTFAWARIGPDGGNPIASTDIDNLVSRLLQDVSTDDMSIAIGFESPLFMPVPADSSNLCHGRNGEGNRAMFAPSGATVATLGLHEIAWILKSIYDRAGVVLSYTLDWKVWPPQGASRILLIWEAFVSGVAHSDSHEQDAATAAVFFQANENNLNIVNAVTTDKPLSMVHAAALWVGWAQDLERLSHGCLVLKPEQAYRGIINPA